MYKTFTDGDREWNDAYLSVLDIMEKHVKHCDNITIAGMLRAMKDMGNALDGGNEL